MNYYLVIISAVLLASSVGLFLFAPSLRMIDKPNGRSSHFIPTCTGMGVLFSIAVYFYALYFKFPPALTYSFIGAFMLLTITAFIDDLIFIKHSFRLVIQVVAVAMMVTALPFIDDYWADMGLIAACVIFGVGVLNAYNFMDGINGLVGLNSLVVLGSFLYLNENLVDAAGFPVHFTDNYFVVSVLISVAIFLFYNLRKKAMAFMGDVGSMGISFIILYLMYNLIFVTGNYLYLAMFSVIGIDAGLTVIYKLIRRENLFVPHRDFLFKRLVHISKVKHTTISIVYAIIQALLNIYIVTRPVGMKPANQFGILFVIMIVQIAVYIYYMNNFVRKKPIHSFDYKNQGQNSGNSSARQTISKRLKSGKRQKKHSRI